MSDQPAIHDDPPAWRTWTKRIITALLIALPLLRLAWLLRSGDARHGITPGPQTTVVTGPLTSDGVIDFTAALNEQTSAGVTPDNNAAVLLIQAYGPGIIPAGYRDRYFELLGIPPLPDEGDYLLDHRKFLARQGIENHELADHLQPLEEAETKAQEGPWTREQLPQMAALLDANETPLALVTAAAERPRFFAPLLPDEVGNLLFLQQFQRVAARCLLSRAMLRIAEGDPEAAWNDLLTCHRLARLTAQSPGVISLLVASALEAIAVSGDEELIKSRLLTAEQARHCLADYDALPPLPRVADVADTTGRLEEIQMFYTMAAGPVEDEKNSDGAGQAPNASRFYNAMDWNVILQMLNATIDEHVAAMRLPTAVEQKAEMNRLEQLQNKRSMRVDAFLWAVVGLNRPVSQEVGGMLVDLASTTYRNLPNSQLRVDARVQVTRIGFALAAFERERGAYPESLDELAPGYLAEMPLDPCSGDPFKYQRTDDGFLLYSIGENLVNDGGKTYEDVPPGRHMRPDDVRIRVGGNPPEQPAAE